MTDNVDLQALESWLREFARLIAAHEDLLTGLDSVIGDGDHGSNMNRGMSAVIAALDREKPSDPAAFFKQVGRTLVSSVGGAAGPLYGTLFLRMGAAAGDAQYLDATGFAKSLRAGLEGVVARGKAQAGDKTMYDAFAPAVEALETALADGSDLDDALTAATCAAESGRDATAPMLARKGRASYLGERSIGHQDPGATSVELLVAAAATALSGGLPGAEDP